MKPMMKKMPKQMPPKQMPPKGHTQDHAKELSRTMKECDGMMKKGK